MAEKSFHIISLGCPKNTVDSASMRQLLQSSGYTHTDDIKSAEVIIVNTCGFIDPAIEESYTVLNDVASTMEGNQVLIAAGCLPERFSTEVSKEVPQVDGVIGTRSWMHIDQLINELLSTPDNSPCYYQPTSTVQIKDQGKLQRFARQGASAYLKIADGCRRSCAFCTIPLIKGPGVSRRIEDIIQDAQLLRDNRVREIILIAQDTTDYGTDLGMKEGLSQLLEEIIRQVPGFDWLRIMYAFPGRITDRLIETMAAYEQILPYIDLPLQHSHPEVLKRMKRPWHTDFVEETIEKLRTAMPEIALRTAFIVGYPGETEEEFKHVLKFVERIRFDHVGTFLYSHESGTPAENLGDPIPYAVKEEREEHLMALQQSISLEKNGEQIGKTLDVLIEGYNEGISIGRTYRDAPEIDGLVIVNQKLTVGDIVPIEITQAMTYDLYGIHANKSPDAV